MNGASGVNAAATLSLAIDTGDAATKLTTLAETYAILRKELGTSTPTTAVADVGKGATEASAQVKTLTAEVAALKAKLDQKSPTEGFAASYGSAFSGLAYKVKIAAADTAEAAKGIKTQLESLATKTQALANQQIKWSFKIDRNFAGEVGKEAQAAFNASVQYDRAWVEAHQQNQQRILEIDKKAAAERAKINSLNESGYAAEQLKKNLAERDKVRAEAAASDKAYLAEAKARLAEWKALDSVNQSGYAAEQLKKNLAERDRVRAEAAASDKAYLAEARARAAEWKKTNELNESGYSSEQLKKNLAERDRVRAEAAAADKAYLAEAKVRAAEWMKIQADEAKWISLTEKQRASATLQAAKVIYAGGQQSVLPGVAGSTQALQAAQSLGSTQAAQAALDRLAQSHTNAGAAAKKNADHHIHWNNIANETHAAARGLSGALGGLWLTYGSIAPLVAGAAIAGSMKSMVKTGMELEYQFSVIKAVTGGATVSVQEFNKAVQGSMFTQTEAAGGLRVLAQAGLSVKEATEALPAVLKLATMGETDMAHAAQAATAIMHTFGLQVTDIAHIGDVFAKAAAISATSVTEMMNAMKQATSVSNIYGVSLEETAAALATLANRGIEGSAAGTAVRNMVKELAAPATAKAAGAMKQLGIEVFNADGSTKSFSENLEQLSRVTRSLSAKDKTRFLEDIFNERGVKAANILLTDLEKMKKILQEIQMSSEGLGFMTEGAIQISQSASGMLKQMQSELQKSFGEVYKSIEPEVKAVIAAITDLVKSSGFKEWLTSIAESVASATKFLREHGEVLAYSVLAYAGLKIAVPLILGIAGAWNIAAAAVAAYNGATFVGPIQQGLSGLATRLGLVAAGAGSATGSLGTLAATGLSLASALPVAAVATLTVGIGYLIITHDDLSKAQRKAIEEQEASNVAMGRLNQTIEQGLNTMVEESKRLDEQIKLLKEGKTAAEAFTLAKYKIGVAEATVNANSARAAFASVEQERSAYYAPPKDGSTYSDINPAPEFNKGLEERYKSLKKLQDTAIDLQDKAVQLSESIEYQFESDKPKKAMLALASSVSTLNEKLNSAKESIPELQKRLQELGSTPTGDKAARANAIRVTQEQLEKAKALANLKTLNPSTATAAEKAVLEEQLKGLEIAYTKAEKKKPLSEAFKADVANVRGELARYKEQENTTIAELTEQFNAHEISKIALIERTSAARLRVLEETEKQAKIIAAKYDEADRGGAAAKARADAKVASEKVNTEKAKARAEVLKAEEDFSKQVSTLMREALGKESSEVEKATEVWQAKFIPAIRDAEKISNEKAVAAVLLATTDSEAAKAAEEASKAYGDQAKKLKELKPILDDIAKSKDIKIKFDADIGELKNAITEVENKISEQGGGFIATIMGGEQIWNLYTDKVQGLNDKISELKANLADAAADGSSQETLAGLKKTINATEKELESVKKSTTKVWSGIIGDIDKTFQSGFVNMLTKGKNSWKDFTAGLKDTFKKTVADAIYQMFAKPFIMSIVANMAGAVGMNGLANAANLAGGSSGMGGITNLLSSGNSLYNAATGQNTLLNKAADFFGLGGSSTSIGATGLAGAGAMEALGGLGSGVVGSIATTAGAASGMSVLGSIGGGITATGGMGLGVSGVAGTAAAMEGVGALGAGISAAGAGTAAAAGTGAAAAGMAAIPVVGWIAAAVAVAYAIFGGKGGAPKQNYGSGFVANATGTIDDAPYNKIAGQLGSGQAMAGQDELKKAIYTDSVKAIVAKYAKDSSYDVLLNSQVNVKGNSSNINDARVVGKNGIIYDYGPDTGKGNDDAQKFFADSIPKLQLAIVTDAFRNANDDYKAIADSIVGTSTNMTDALSGLSADAVAAMQSNLSGMASLFDAIKDQINDKITGQSVIEIAKLAGGFANLTTQVNDYYANYYSQSEKTTKAHDQLAKQFGELNLTMPATKDGFRKLVESLDVTTESGQKSFAALMGLSGAFASLTSTVTKSVSEIASERASLQSQLDQVQGNTGAIRARELDALDPSNRALQQQIWAVGDAKAAEDARQQAADAAKSKADNIASEAASLQNQIDQSMGNTAAIRERELAALDPANHALQEYIYSLEDAKTASENAAKAVDDAYSALERAVGAEKDKVNAAYDAQVAALDAQYQAAKDNYDAQKQMAQDALNAIQKVADDLKNALKSVTVESDALLMIQRQNAKSVLTSALNYSNSGGSLANYAGLNDALAVVAKPSEQLYTSFEDYAREQGQIAGTIADMGKNADAQVSVAQMTLDAINGAAQQAEALYQQQKKDLARKHEEDLKALDDILNNAKDQLDALNGINTSVLSVAAALGNFAAAMSARNQPSGSGGAGTFTPATTAPAGGAAGRPGTAGAAGAGAITEPTPISDSLAASLSGYMGYNELAMQYGKGFADQAMNDPSGGLWQQAIMNKLYGGGVDMHQSDLTGIFGQNVPTSAQAFGDSLSSTQWDAVKASSDPTKAFGDIINGILGINTKQQDPNHMGIYDRNGFLLANAGSYYVGAGGTTAAGNPAYSGAEWGLSNSTLPADVLAGGAIATIDDFNSIADRLTTAPTNTAIETLYQSILGRAPETAGVDYWSQKMAAGMTTEQLAAQLMMSEEYQKTLTGFASGGVASAGYYLAGENGPELIQSDSATRIYPAEQTSALMARLQSPSQNNAVLAAKLDAVIEELNLLRAENRAIVNNTKRTATALDRAMPDGDALAVRTTA